MYQCMKEVEETWPHPKGREGGTVKEQVSVYKCSEPSVVVVTGLPLDNIAWSDNKSHTYSSNAPLPQRAGSKRCGRFSPLWPGELHGTSPADLQRVKAHDRTYKSLPILWQEKKLPDALHIPIDRGIDLAIIISQQPIELLVSILPASEWWLW